MGKENTAYKISPSDYFPAHINCLSHLGKTVKTIKNKLSQTQLSMFRKTCFGKLLDIEIAFNGPFIHHFLLREAYEENEDVMSFILGGTIVTFSKREFDLITGLWHSGKQVELRPSNRLQKLIFKDKEKMTVGELEQTFISICLPNDEDVVKFSLVYFIELAMLGKERKVWADNTLLSIVDDSDTFRNYDWSSVIFERTLRGLQNALKNKALVYKEKHKSNPTRIVKYGLRGFPYAFQVWAYETITSLSIHVAKRLNDTTIPRILQWSSPHSTSFGIIEKKIFARMMDVKQVLKMTENEKQAIDAMKGFISSPPSPPFPSHNIAHQEMEHIDVEPREEPMIDDEPSSFYGKDEMPKKKKRRIKPKHELRAKLFKNYFKCTKETRIKVLEDDMKCLKEDMKCLKEDMALVLSTLQNMVKHFHKGQEVDEEPVLDHSQLGDTDTKPLEEVKETNDIGETFMERLNEIEGRSNEVEFCDICGDAGYAELLVSCCRCKMACEHIYCMRAHLKNIPQSWVCESCL